MSKIRNLQNVLFGSDGERSKIKKKKIFRNLLK